jgi:hypothetical protein
MADVGVFPVLSGLAWPPIKTPIFQTRVQRSVSGRELVALDYPYPLWQFTLVFDFLRDNPAGGFDELRTLMGFFLLCRGAFGRFLYQDPTDFSVTGQGVGTGDGATTVFQLGRTMTGGFFEPVANIASSSLKVYFNGVQQSLGGLLTQSDWGIITFAVPPAIGTVITADFLYYFRCRFVDDSLAFENFMQRLWTLKKLSFISVRP